MKDKLTPAQLAVLKRLAAGDTIRHRQRFWDNRIIIDFASGDERRIAPATLNSLESAGLIAVAGSSGPLIAIYAITDAGRAALKDTGEGEGRA